jgi:hypothetical protein
MSAQTRHITVQTAQTGDYIQAQTRHIAVQTAQTGDYMSAQTRRIAVQTARTESTDRRIHVGTNMLHLSV